MRKDALRYAGVVLIQRALGLLCYLLGARFMLSFRAAAYFIVYFAVAVVSMAVTLRLAPETLAARGRKADSPSWDKLLLGVYWLLAFFGIYLVAGLEAASARPAGAAFWIGLLIVLLSSALALWAVLVNRFLETGARLQTERDQTVCEDGPYRFVRHPTYAAILIWCAGISLTFGTSLTSVTAAVVAAVIVLRTAKEDAMLRAGLAGYENYAKRTKYRLVPYIW